MRKSSLWQIGTPLAVICLLFGCTTAIEHESISTIAVDPTWTPAPTLDLPATAAADPTWTPTPTLDLPTTTAADHTGTPAATLDLRGRIAFTSDRDGDANIYVMNADGTGQRRLTDNPAQDWSPAWSPDGRSIAFYSYRDGNQDVYVMNADGSDQRNLSQIPDMGPSLDNIKGPPSWSPDGRRIVFGFGYRGDMGRRMFEIYAIDADGSNLHNLGYGLSPVWSSDGDSIVFVCGHYPSWAICEMNADGSDRRHLINMTLDGIWSSNLAVSPDGRSIALGYYAAYDTGSAEVYILDADGSNLRYLTEDPSADWSPTFSPDSCFILFTSYRDGNCEIYVMNADGSNQRNLSQHPAHDTNPAWSP